MTQVSRYGHMLKVTVNGMRMHVTARYRVDGSVLNDTVQGRMLGAETTLEIDSPDSPERVAKVVRTAEPPAKTQPGLHHVAWRLDNFEELQAAYKELKRMGIPLDGTVEHNVTRSVYFFDPDGNRVELYCDMVENGFETMRTVGPKRDPLNLE